MTNEKIESLRATSLVTRPQGSWKWQDRYGVNVYAPYLSTSGVWRWRLYQEGRDVASVGRARLAPDVETDWVGRLHGVALADGPEVGREALETLEAP